MPMDVLRAATTVPARYLDRAADLGGITTGKQADLVLLRSNPLEDISNSDDVEVVVANGRALTRDRLDALLKEAEALARGK